MIQPVSQEQIQKLNGRRIIASVSGGKDSAAMCLYLKENGLEYQSVFIDTGWEADETYDYLRNTLPKVIGPIEWIRAELQMEELILKKLTFPSKHKRFCTSSLKMEPLTKYLNNLKLDDDFCTSVGIRKGESAARAKMPEWEWSDSFDCEIWRPLLDFTEQDVIDMHRRHDLRPNPLYLKGATRVGCYPCILAQKKDIRVVAENSPERIDRIRNLETEVAKRRLEKADGKPTCLPTYFRSKPTSSIGKPDGSFPIDDVVYWSKTAWGGKQLQILSASDAEAGCMRWGLCETNSDSDNQEEEN